jgi:hypothetical protein
VIGGDPLTMKFGGDAAIALSGPLKGDALDVVAQFCVRVWLWHTYTMTVMSCARQRKHPECCHHGEGLTL